MATALTLLIQIRVQETWKLREEQLKNHAETSDFLVAPLPKKEKGYLKTQIFVKIQEINNHFL
jgi:hypothetical protein